MADAYLFQPRFQALSLASPQHRCKLLNQPISGLKRRVNVAKEGELFLLSSSQCFRWAQVQPDGLFRVLLVKRAGRGYCLFSRSPSSLRQFRLYLLHAGSTPAVQVAIERARGASIAFCLKFFVQALPIVTSLFDALTEIRGIGIKGAGASAAGSGFGPLSPQSAHRPLGKAYSRGNLVSGVALIPKFEHLLILIQALSLAGLFGLFQYRFLYSTLLPSLCLGSLGGLCLDLSLLFERIDLMWWRKCLGGFSDLGTHSSQKGMHIFTQITKQVPAVTNLLGLRRTNGCGCRIIRGPITADQFNVRM